MSQSNAFAALLDLRPSALIDVAEVWLRDPRPAARRQAVHVLAWLGGPEYVPLLLRSLASADPAMIASAASGADLAHDYNLLNPADRARIVRRLMPIATGTRRCDPDRDLEVLLGIAVDTAINLGGVDALRAMVSAKSMSPHNPAVRHILLALQPNFEIADVKRKPQPKAKWLWRVFDAAQRRSLHPAARKYSDHILGLTLVLAAAVDPVRTRREAAQILATRPGTRPFARELAGQAIRRCTSLPEPRALLATFRRSPHRFGAQAVSLLRVVEFVDQIRADGLFAFLDDHAASVRSVVAGLRLIGLAQVSKLLDDAASQPTLRRAAAAVARGKRSTRLPTDSELDFIDRAETKLWASLPRIEGSVHEFIAAHPETFAKVVSPIRS